MKYCITHEMEASDWEDLGESPFCSCIITSCPPPEELDGWEYTMSLPEPSEDELILMEMSAEALEADFIGELS